LAESAREVFVGREPLTGSELQAIFEEVLPVEEILAFAEEMGVVQRQRKLDVAALVLALIITAGTPSGGWHADALRNYFKLNAPKVARSSFYDWFDPPFEALMARLAERALVYCQAQELDLPGPLRTVLDWRVVDSETVKLPKPLQAVYPGTGDFAAVKVHKVLSIGSGCPVAYHLSPSREHDSKHLEIDASWRDYGLLADKAYASIARLEACNQHGVAFVIRLKEGWKPKVDYIARGTQLKELTVGSELSVVLESVLALDGKAIDCDVRIGERGLAARLVGIDTPKGYCFFLTNLPPFIGPVQVANLYRVRWEIELTNKLDKSVHRLDHTGAERSCSLGAMLHACLLSSMLTALIVHRYHLNTRPRGSRSRDIAPLHQLLVAKAIASAHDIFHRSLLGEEDRWDFLAEYVVHLGKDPNWRRKPSTLDQMRGSRVLPKTPSAKAKSASAKRA
jgi:hypothetical protein